MVKLVILAICFCFTIQNAQAFIVKDTADKPTKLVAQKGGVSKNFSLQKGIKVWYRDGDSTYKVKGFLAKITKDSITVKSFRKKRAKQQIIPIASITALSKIDVKLKRTLYSILVIASLLAIPASFAGAASASVLSYIYIIPIAVAFGVLQYVIPLMYIIQSVSKVKVEKGWKISAH